MLLVPQLLNNKIREHQSMKIHSTVKREDVCSLGNSVDKEIYGRLVGCGTGLPPPTIQLFRVAE